MPDPPPTAFAAFIGIDWANEQHAVALSAEGSKRPEITTLDHESGALEDWAADLRTRFQGHPCAVCLEQSRGALIYALMRFEFLVLFPINPKQLARYREAVSPSGAKDDPTDAVLLADFVRRQHTRLRAWCPDDASPRQLERLLPHPRRRADAEDFQDHSWLTRVRAAQPLVVDGAVILAGQFDVQTLVSQLQLLNRAISEYDAQIAKDLARHPDAELFRSIPGGGPSLTPRLIGAFGTDRSRFQNATAVQEFSGIAPVTKRSGQTHTVHRRRACSKFLRQSFHELADHSRKGSSWAGAYYRMLGAKGQRHHASIRALAFKWIRILFRCCRDRVAYNEQHYLERLQKTRSPIIQYLTQDP